MTRQAVEEKPEEVAPGEMADILQASFHFATTAETDELLFWSSGVYKRGGEILVKSEVERRLPDCTKRYCEEVVGHLKRRTYHLVSEFDKDSNVINFPNGLYHRKTKRLLPHNPGYLSLIQLGGECDPLARPALLLKAISQIMPDPADRLLLFEEMASAFMPSQKLKAVYLWEGGGHNGKGLLSETFEAVLGPENVSHLSLIDLTRRFAPASLIGKLANIGEDIGDQEIKDNSTIKTISGGGRVFYERKGVQGRDSDEPPRVKFFFIANKQPVVKDATDAWLVRTIWTKFPVQFLPRPIEANKQVWPSPFAQFFNEGIFAEPSEADCFDDKGLKARIKGSSVELSGFLNVLLRVLDILEARGDFARRPTIAETKSIVIEHQSPIESFVNSCLNLKPSAHSRKDHTYSAYVQYCTRRNFTPETVNKFGRELGKTLSSRGLTVDTDAKDAKGARIWKGIELREKPSKETDASTLDTAEGSP